jgi:hypothetical protein
MEYSGAMEIMQNMPWYSRVTIGYRDTNRVQPWYREVTVDSPGTAWLLYIGAALVQHVFLSPVLH